VPENHFTSLADDVDAVQSRGVKMRERASGSGSADLERHSRMVKKPCAFQGAELPDHSAEQVI
jgi:hypothetical protein